MRQKFKVLQSPYGAYQMAKILSEEYLSSQESQGVQEIRYTPAEYAQIQREESSAEEQEVPEDDDEEVDVCQGCADPDVECTIHEAGKPAGGSIEAFGSILPELPEIMELPTNISTREI